MELTYKRIGDYYIPDLGVGKDEHQYIDRWGMMHANYLKEHRPGVYTRLILSGKYTQTLVELNAQAEERLMTIINQMKMAEGVTELMKMNDQMLWVQHMNSIRSRAEEIIMNEMIYT